MIFQDFNVCLQFMSFLHLDEWMAILYMNKEHFNTLKPKMLPWIKKCVSERLVSKLQKALGDDKIE